MPRIPTRFRNDGAWVQVETGMSAAGVAAQLQASGYETHATPAGRRVWFAPTVGPQPLIQASQAVVQGQDPSVLDNVLAAAGEPPRPEPAFDLFDLKATADLRGRLRAGSSIEVMQMWRDRCIAQRGANLIRLLDTILLPELFARWPDSAVYFVGPTDRTHALSTAARTHALRETTSWQHLREAAGAGRGFPILRALHTGIGASAHLYLALTASLTLPANRIWIIPRLPGEIVVVLGDAVRVPAQAVGAREFLRDPLQLCYLAPGHAERFHQPVRATTPQEARAFLEEAVERLNAMMELIFGIHRRRTDHGRADCVSTMKLAFVIERIAQAVLSISTSEAEYGRVNDSFALMDLLSSLAMRRLAARIDAVPARGGASNNAVRRYRGRLMRRREPALGDALISDAALQGLVIPSLDQWRCAAASGLSVRARQLLQGLHADSDRSVFIRNRRPNGDVQFRFREVDEATARRGRWRTRNVPQAALAGTLLRQLRNTHHGYELFDELFEGLLALTDGGIGDHLPAFLEHVWLAILGAPARWLEGGLADVVPLPAAAG